MRPARAEAGPQTEEEVFAGLMALEELSLVM